MSQQHLRSIRNAEAEWFGHITRERDGYYADTPLQLPLA
jgi:hypothetical protein